MNEPIFCDKNKLYVRKKKQEAKGARPNPHRNGIILRKRADGCYGCWPKGLSVPDGERSKVLRNSGSLCLLRVVRRVFDACVPPRVDVPDHRLTGHLGRLAAVPVVGVGISAVVLVIVRLATSVGNADGGVARAVRAASSAV